MVLAGLQSSPILVSCILILVAVCHHMPGSAGLSTHQTSAACSAQQECRDKLEDFHHEKIKRIILDQLGMTSPPNITKEKVLEIWSGHASLIQDDESPEDEVPTLPTPNKAGAEMLRLPEEDLNCTHDILRYSLMSNITRTIRVKNAHLLMRVQSRRSKRKGKKSRVTIRLHRVNENGEKEFANWAIRVRRTKWHELQLPTLMVQEAINSDSKVLKLRVTCDDCDKHVHPILCEVDKTGETQNGSAKRKRKTKTSAQHAKKKGRMANNNNALRIAQIGKEQTSRPFLRIRTRGTPRSRSRSRSLQKRSTGSCHNEGQGTCSMESFYVDFEKLDWDKWIVSPKGYQANYCQGQCHDMRHHSLSHLRGLHPKQYKGGQKLNGCCIPIKTQALSLVYLGSDGSIIQTAIPDMITRECRCV